MLAEFGGQRLQPRRIQRLQQRAYLRQQCEAIAQGAQVARAGAAQGDAGEDAFEVPERVEAFAQVGVDATVEQRGHGMVAFAQHVLVAQGPVQPAAQQAAAHRRHRAVEHAEQGIAGVAVHARVEFQVPARRRVHGDGVVGGLQRDRRQMRQALLLGFLDVAEQGRCRGDAQRLALEPEAREVVQVEELQQLAAAAVRVEQPGRATAQPAALSHDGRPAVLVGQQQFCRIQPRQFGFQRVVVADFVDQETPARQVGPRESIAIAAARQCQQQRVAALAEQRLVGHRAGRHHANDLAFDQPR